MTNWTEVEDLELDQEFDEFDPMAAPRSDSFSDAGDDTERDVLDRADGPWRIEDGFPDGFGVVRVWCDDEGRLTKVRLSPGWREKMGKTPLAVAFARAFAFMSSYLQKETGAADLSSDEREAQHPFSWERLDHVSRQTSQLTAQLENLGPEGDGRWVGQKAVGESPDKMCAIHLELDGSIGSIQFNERKLADSRVKEVTTAVLRAHAAALANYVPGSYEPGERDRVTGELHDLRNELLAMMRRGFR